MPGDGTRLLLDPPPGWDVNSWRCALLWTEVVRRALIDARVCCMLNTPGYVKLGRSQTREWLRRPSFDRQIVFDLAGIDVAAFDSRGLPLLEAKWQRIDEARMTAAPYEHVVKRAA